MPTEPNRTLIRNLDDAGMDAVVKKQFLELETEGKKTEQLRLLRQHRKNLLTTIHENQKKIDCLDYLVFQFEAEGQPEASVFRVKR